MKNVNYAEGFIRKYAKAVNIDSVQLIEAHREEIPSNDESLQNTITAFSKEDKPTYRTKNKEPLQVAVVISIFVIITALLWIFSVLIF